MLMRPKAGSGVGLSQDELLKILDDDYGRRTRWTRLLRLLAHRLGHPDRVPMEILERLKKHLTPRRSLSSPAWWAFWSSTTRCTTRCHPGGGASPQRHPLRGRLKSRYHPPLTSRGGRCLYRQRRRLRRLIYRLCWSEERLRRARDFSAKARRFSPGRSTPC